MEQKYEKWTADATTLEIFIEDDPNPIIELDQQEQEVGSWKILPLSSPSKVQFVLLLQTFPLCVCRSLKLLSRNTKLVEESLTVDLS